MSKTGGSASYPGRLIIYQVDEAYGTGTSGATVLASTVALFPGGDVATETDVSATATLNASTSRLVLVVDLQSATNAVFSLATAGWGAVTGYRLPENRPDDVLTDLQWPLVQSMARRRWVGAIRADTDAISTGTRWFIDGTDLTISVAENAIRMFDSGEDINDIGAWEVDTSYTATSTSASSAGAVISLGAGADRRHYVYLRNGYVGVLNNSNAALDGAVSAATYDLSEQVGLRLFRRPDGTGYIEATGPDGTKTRRDVANIPTGRVYAASRANATCKIHHLTIVPAACAVADVDQRVTALETLAGLAATVPLGFTVLPNYPAARDTATNGFGFTCTGLDRFPTDTTFAGCWLVGDDGRMIEGDGTPLAGAAHILSPDKRTILRSFAFGEVSSVQGVACVDDDTFWVALSTLKEIRHYNIGGTLLATLEWDTLGYTGDPNGLAWDSANSGLWVTTAASATARLLLASDGTLLDTVTLATTTPDQLHYDSANGLLYATTGSNGTPGTVHVHRVSTDTAVGSYASLRHAEAIEGIYLDRETATLTLTNDGQYHNIARPALNCLPEYRVSLFT
ncbi:hypothetical protein U713_07530 [Rhodobacter capsulatus YW2]|nr:hypothetical protein U713_07530 [Rhodobacter capsulatus YW2]